MHEMGVALSIVERAERHARANGAKQVVRLTLQIGELSGVVPGYLEKCWGHAVETTILEGCALDIEVVDGKLKCCECGNEYLALENEKDGKPTCPECHCHEWNVISGLDIRLKDIAII